MKKLTNIIVRKILPGLLISLALVFVFSDNSVSAAILSRYWVGADAGCISKNWNDTACWSATNGGVSGASVPNNNIFDTFTAYFTSNAMSLADCNVNISPTLTAMYMQTGYTNTVFAGSSTMTFIGTLSILAGTFNAGTSTIIFGGAGVSSTLDVQAAGQTFYNIQVNKTNATTNILNTSSNDTITVSNFLTLTSGRLGIFTGGQIICNNFINWESTFTGGNPNTNYLGFLVIRDDTTIPAGQINLPGIKIDNILSSVLEVYVGTGSGGVDFYGNFEIVNNSGTGGSFFNLSDQNLNFQRNLLVSAGAFYAGNTLSSSPIISFSTGTATKTLTVTGGSFYAQSSTLNLDAYSTITVSGGIFYGANSVINILRASSVNLTLSSGSFIAPSGNMTINGGIAYSGGTFTHSNGTIIVGGSASVNIDVPVSGLVLYNLFVRKSTSTSYLSTSSNDTITVNGELEFSTGQIAIYNGSKIEAKGTVDWQSGFNGRYVSSTYLGYLDLFVGVVLPDPSGGLTPQLPSIRLNSTFFETNFGNTSPVTFGGYFEINGVSSFENMAGVNLTFNYTMTVNGGNVDFYAGTHSFVDDLVVNSGAVSVYLADIMNFVSIGSQLLINGGTVYAQNANINIDGTASFVLNGGTFNAPSTGKTLSLAGNMTVGALATFNVGLGTVVFDGAYTSTLSLPSGFVFRNFTLSKDNATNYVLIGSGSNSSVSGVLSLGNGKIAIYNSTIFSAEGTINWTSDFDGNYESSFYRGSFQIKTTGTYGDVDIPDTAIIWPSLVLDNSNKSDLKVLKIGLINPVSVYNFTIATGISTGANFELKEGSSMTVSNDLIINNGAFLTKGGDLSIGSSFSISGGLLSADTVTANTTVLSFSGSNSFTISGGEVNLTQAESFVGNSTGANNIYATGGTLKAPPLISLIRGFDFGAGFTFVHNSGQIRLVSLNSATIYSRGTSKLFELVVEKNALANSVSIGSSVSLDGSLRLFVGTLGLGSFTHYVGGDVYYVDAGVNSQFNAGTSTVVLNGLGQFLSGPLQFYRLTKIAEVADTLFFPEDVTVTITNTTTLSGVDLGNKLSLRSNGQGGLQWKIDPQGTRVFSYLDVKDSNNVNATIANAGVGSISSGNNTNWSFGYKYWVGSAVNCDGTYGDSDCWSASSGGAGGDGVPGVNDTIFFDSGDATNCYGNTTVNVKGIRVEPGYLGRITFEGITVTIGTERFLQRDADVGLVNSNMVNTDNFYLYGGTFTLSGGTFSSLDFYYNYFTPRSASGDFSGASSMDINGHFIFGSNTDSSTGTFTAPSGNLSVSGNFYSYTSNNSVFAPNGGTFIFDGAGDSVYDFSDSGVDFYNLTLNKDSSSAKLSVSADIDINGNLSISRGTLEVPVSYSPKFYLAGNFLRTNLTGVFSEGTSEVVLDGGSQTINNSNNFYKLTKIASGALQTLTFQAGSTTTISSVATIKGNTSNILSLRSSTSGNIWYINPSGTRDFTYLDVKDSTNSNAVAITSLNSLDSGNNSNWDFGFKYWVGPDAGTWNDSNNWSSTSGGAGGAGIPDVNSMVIFDGNTSCTIPDATNITVQSIYFTSSFTKELRGGTGTFQTITDLTVSGGKFELGSGALTVGRDLYQNGGVFQGGAGSIVIGEDVRVTGGSFSAGTASTFLVNIMLDINNKSGDPNEAIVDFTGVSLLDVNNSFYLGATQNFGVFYAPTNGEIRVALDVYFAVDSGFNHQNSTLTMDGGSGITLQTSNQSLYNLKIDKQSPLNSVLLSNDLLLAGSLNFVKGSVNPVGDIYIAGDWNMGQSDFTNFVSGYSTGNKTVYLNGQNQAINGSTTFANLSKINNLGVVPLSLTFEAGATQIITGALTLNGSSTSMRILLRSSSPSIQAMIDPRGSRSIQFLDVQDNYNINATDIEAYNTGSVDSGNNLGWNFDLTVNSWVDAFSTFNMRLFTGAYRGVMEIYKIVAPFMNNWTYDKSLTGAGRIRSSIVFNGGLYMGGSDGVLYRRNFLGFDLKSVSDVANGQYSYIAKTFKPGTNFESNLYIDGVLNSSLAITTSATQLDAWDLPLYLGTSYGSTVGGNNASGEEYFKGKIDEFRLSNQTFTAQYIQTVYNNLSEPSTFISFASEEEYSGQPGGTGELPTMTDKESVFVRGEIGAGTLWITGHGGFEGGIRLEKGSISPEQRPIKWYYNEEVDFISFKDSSSPDGFRIQLYMVSEDSGNFVYSGTNLGGFNIPVENFKVYGNYNVETGEPMAATKGVDDPTATLSIDQGESCSDALNMDNYIFGNELISGDFGMSMTGAAQTYLKSNVSCITQGKIDIRSMMLMLPPSCVDGDYSSTLYILIVNGADGL